MWVKHCIKERYDYYYNLETGEGTWEEPEGYEHNGGQLCKEEIQVPSVLLRSFTTPLCNVVLTCLHPSDVSDFILGLTMDLVIFI